ncbi:bifunctional folylpolyglutamate synthase/dihydrofolate synthase [Cyclobacterium marinum]|uniref:Dihydrofolate synthase/folylpolyglutamate synthase n=1 Tax=Cyclobacterium marinum (strain ATCC 25205 / DSM 745 / LMG 13164 / NCIMB 1802) TaxID=880070 RepID=G0IWG7_CYCMS|nr:folylpolyglutamate synthase/dihydrofolate synthase family protein [Cyclobacterium marinum]AEL27961.1 FolC bifunctional protein [Cyclobacterium marinum DSM 745]|tara:strand:+ start:340 stop:1647 length:1308 start_codon:yes stop_codon:yes gene_type:complete
MNYQSSLDFLFQALPMFQRVGGAAFKKDLSNTLKLCAHLGNPQNKFKSIHIAGTNGKGSTAHALASVLQAAGYNTGLYTSPHLKSFRERIKINGIEIPENEVVAFVEANKTFLSELKPSFFEMTVALSFAYFAKKGIDYAVIETGMGGRFDSTNVIQPLLSIITNIGFDHEQFLGDTLDKIAFEKAGIIKDNVPVVIGQTHDRTASVFRSIAADRKAAITFADQSLDVKFNGYNRQSKEKNLAQYTLSGGTASIENIELDLLGSYQAKNLPAIMVALDHLKTLGLQLHTDHIKEGLSNITTNTGLKGRWQILSSDPLTICDTGHNEDGIQEIIEQLLVLKGKQKLYMILGMVKDKAHYKVLAKLPKDAYYFFCQADQPRSMPANALKNLAAELGLQGEVIENVNEALQAAEKKATKEDLIFIGGSTFVVAEINDL